ncbi:unnamed protein product [Closterium sp. NIES-64]|nr:unnamed protein product [Closterium sp. NIES-64]
MAGNRCGACGQELESDNLLRILLYRNDTCRDTLLERLESRAVEALAEALAEVRNSPHHSDSESVPSSPHSADSLFRYLREFPEHADFVRGYVSTSDDGSVSTVGDLFNTLNELYLFFKDADLSDREINRVLHIFNHPGYDPAAVRRWQNVADVRRFGEEHVPDDMMPWLKAEIEVRGPGGRSQMLELLYKDTKLAELPEEDSMVLGVISYSDSTYASGNGRLQAWPMLMGLVNVPEELRWREPGHALMGVLPFPPEWASATEKTRVYQEAYRIVMGPLMRCRATATMQQASHRPCSSCYIKKAHLHDLSNQSIVRTVKGERHAAAKILSATTVEGAAAIQASRKFGVKGETRSVLVRIPGGSTFFRSGANYAAFEYRGMMQVFPIVISDLCVGRSAEESDQKDKEAVRSMKPAVTRTSKAMCLMMADDPLRMLYRETVGSEFDNMATLMAAEGLQTSRVLVHTAVAIPSTKGGYLVPKAMFGKASPKENWFTDIAIPGEREEEEEEEEWWYARCLCIFKAVNYSGEEGAYVFVKYYEEEGVCPQTLCPQLVPGRKEATHGIIEVASIERIVHVCKSFTYPRIVGLAASGTLNQVELSADGNTWVNLTRDGSNAGVWGIKGSKAKAVVGVKKPISVRLTDGDTLETVILENVIPALWKASTDYTSKVNFKNLMVESNFSAAGSPANATISANGTAPAAPRASSGNATKSDSSAVALRVARPSNYTGQGSCGYYGNYTGSPYFGMGLTAKLPASDFGNPCGACYTISCINNTKRCRNGKAIVTVRVVGESGLDNQLALPLAVWSKLVEVTWDRTPISITLKRTNCVSTVGTQVRVRSVSSAEKFNIQIVGLAASGTLNQVELSADGNTWVNLMQDGSNAGVWGIKGSEAKAVVGVKKPISVRLTAGDTLETVVRENVIPALWKASTDYTSKVNFKNPMVESK